jgi:hypothetical protein
MAATGYQSWSVTFNEQPTFTKWNILGTNDDYFNTSLTDGWVDSHAETWTYVSATTFTISGDKTSKYQAGDIIRLKQGGAYKYFYIVSASYSSPNTTITVKDGIDGATYTLASAGITDNWFSKSANPQGLPATASFNNLGYAQITGNFSTASAAAVQVTGLTVSVYAPGRKIKIVAFAQSVNTNAGGQTMSLSIWDGVVSVGTKIQESSLYGATSNGSFMIAEIIVGPSAASKTYNVGFAVSGSTGNIFASATAPAFILVEII